MDPVDDISSLLEYYDDKRKDTGIPEVGQIVFAPVVYTDRRPHVVEVKRSDSHSHASVNFNFRLLNDGVDFKKKPDRLPIKSLDLAETEELLAQKAKKRPCLVLASVDGVNPKSLPEGAQRQKVINGFDKAYLLAPIYSISMGLKETAFGPIMTARTKCMMYPEFVYAPQKHPALDCPGVIRLDRLFWTHLIGCVDRKDLFLTPDLLGICWTQLMMICGEEVSDEYTELRDLLLSYLPAECK